DEAPPCPVRDDPRSACKRAEVRERGSRVSRSSAASSSESAPRTRAAVSGHMQARAAESIRSGSAVIGSRSQCIALRSADYLPARSLILEQAAVRAMTRPEAIHRAALTDAIVFLTLRRVDSAAVNADRRSP